MKEGSTVAIAAEGDSQYDFFLVKVTGEWITSATTKYDYGTEFPSNTDILQGHFNLRENIIDMTYTLDKKMCVVATQSVRYKCGEVKRTRKGIGRKGKTIYSLTIEPQEDIMVNLQT